MSRKNKTAFTLAGCASFGILYAPNKLLGLFFIHLQRDLDSSASLTSLALGINLSLMYLYGPIETVIFKKCGARIAAVIGIILSSFGFALSSFMTNVELIAVSFGIFTALGVGICNLSWYTMSGHAVPERLSFVNNMFSTSHSMVGFVMAPLTQYLIELYGWRGALLLTGGIILNALPLGLLMTWYYKMILSNKLKVKSNNNDSHIPAEDSTSNELPCCEKDGQSTKRKSGETMKSGSPETWKRLLTNRYFVCYAFAMSFVTVSRFSVGLYTVRYAQSVGINESKAIWIITLQELSSVLVGPISGYLTSFSASSIRKMSIRDQDSTGVRRRMSITYRSCVSIRRSRILAIFSILFSLSIMIPVLFETFVGFLVGGFFNGIFAGSTTALPVTILSDFFRSEDLAAAQGLRCLLAGIWLIVYPFTVGSIIDMTGSYRPAQYFAAFFSLCCAGFTMITEIGLNNNMKKNTLSTMA
uniref:monocarboxylate transporter 12-like isoform X1 n=1 Tax=Styela clava TaxID=7725 RepID=UPI001939CA3F|nr:monocarboxylate transporter 12-like isoform X1 [Styela clava]